MSCPVTHFAENFGEAYAEILPELGESIAQILRFFGGRNIYGVGGDFAANLITALSPHLDLSASSNEMHAGFSACGQAEITGLGVALTTYTVGSLPCTSAAALAITEKLPVVFISGAPGESEVSEHTIHHTVAPGSAWHAQYDCALNAFRALGMKAERLQGARSERQPNMAGERFFQLVCEAYLNKQPVFIEIPRDLVFSKTQAIALPSSLSAITRDNFILKGAELIAKQIANKLAHSEKPLLFIGEGVKLNKPLCQQLMRLSHEYKLPYATTRLAKGIFDEFDPLYVGCYNGILSDPTIREFVDKQIDYVLEVDTSIQPQDTNSAFNTGTHAIESFENKTVIKGTVQNQQGLINIFDHLLKMTLPTFSVTLPMRDLAESADEEKLDFHNLTRVLNSIQAKIEPSLVYLPEVGNSYFASYGLVTKRAELGRSWLTNPWYAAMGTSLPYARAVSKTIKQNNLTDVPVVITGDGGFNFQLNELIHFQKEGLPLIIIYMRNDIYHLGKSGEQDIYQCSTPEFEPRTLIQAYGGIGLKCLTVGAFVHAMNTAIRKNSGLTLIEVPAMPTEEYQCYELKMLNLYIKAKNGDPDAIEQWQSTTLDSQ